MLTKVLHRNFASKMMAGSTNNKRDSAGRRLGIKKWGNSEVRPGDIIAKQRGYKWHPGNHVHGGKDHTIHASVEGVIAWSRDRYSHRKRNRINVIPRETPNRQFPAPPAFVYHPEMYPELAEMNPQPVSFDIPKQQPKKQRNPRKLSCSHVAVPSQEATGYLNVSKLINPDTYAQNRDFASNRLDLEAHDEF